MRDREYGHWSADGKEYVITERKTPRHWYNYYFNDTYNAFMSQIGFGEGFCQDDMGRRLQLVKDRCVYVCDREKNTWHTATGLPLSASYDLYECRHGLGYSTIVCEKNGIRSEYTVFVPIEGDCELWSIKLTNLRKTVADLSVVAYADTECDGAYRPQGYNNYASDYDPETASVAIFLQGKVYGGKKSDLYTYMLSGNKIDGYDCRRNAFIGVYGSKTEPEAFSETVGCKNSACCTEKMCFALESPCRLASGESKTVCFRIGQTETRENLLSLRHQTTADAVETDLEALKASRSEEIGGVTIKTPDERFNLAFNGFYKYSADMGSRWARVRHNGYRDLASDIECYGSFNPEHAWERFKRLLTYQYSTGYCPRTFIDGAIKPNNYSDCAVWITFTAHALVTEIGNGALLDEEVLFNDGTSATVFEHLRRAVEYLYNFQGLHGLIKIWGGDWNDSLNETGLEGKGVSVWLSIAWVRANRLLMELAPLAHREDLLPLHREMDADMRTKIEQYGWDGKYYIAAINDKGEKVGSHKNKEGKMYLNPQTWAVLAELAPREKLLEVMKEVDSYLETPLGTLINRPAYTKYDPSVGNITRLPVGTLINEAVYLQPMAWKLASECMLKRPEKLQMTLKKILPWGNADAPTCGEPYILYNFYHTEKTGYRYGTPGQSWRTATASCVVKAVITYIYGLKPTMDGLQIDPCLPPEWTECEIRKIFRGIIYDIHYHNSGRGQLRILANGKELKGNILPLSEKGKHIPVDVYL